MVSSLEVAPGSDARRNNTDNLPPPARRGKRDSSSITTPPPGGIIMMPIMMLMILIQALYRSMATLAKAPMLAITECVRVNRQTDEILDTVPEEQQEQRQELEHIHEVQVYQKDRLENLRRRVARIEERRAVREAPALTCSNKADGMAD